MIGFNNTITLFTPYALPEGGIRWQKMTIPQCSFRVVTRLSTGSDGVARVKAVVLRIPVRDDYVEPQDFVGEGFTLLAGSIVVSTTTPLTIPDNDSGNSLLDALPHTAHTVESVSVRVDDSVIPHYRGDLR